MLHSKINYFGEFIRSLIEAKSSYAGKVFMLEKVLMLFMLEGMYYCHFIERFNFY